VTRSFSFNGQPEVKTTLTMTRHFFVQNLLSRHEARGFDSSTGSYSISENFGKKFRQIRHSPVLQTQSYTTSNQRRPQKSNLLSAGFSLRRSNIRLNVALQTRAADQKDVKFLFQPTEPEIREQGDVFCTLKAEMEQYLGTTAFSGHNT
jgi:hypothetical protein